LNKLNLNKETGKKDKAWLRYLKYIIAGLVTGTANGLFGSGGGTIAVPAMVHMMDMEENRAHATAISIILPLTLLSAFFYVKGNYVDWWIALKVSIGGVAGGYLGAKLLPVVPDRILRKVFGIFMILAGVRMVF
jgi:uncharacterized membrane protein YfcA